MLVYEQTEHPGLICVVYGSSFVLLIGYWLLIGGCDLTIPTLDSGPQHKPYSEANFHNSNGALCHILRSLTYLVFLGVFDEEH